MMFRFPLLRKLTGPLVILALGIGLVGLGSCQPTLKKPELVSVSQIVIREMDDSLLTIEVTAAIRNANISVSSVSSVNANVFLDGAYLGTGSSKGGFEIMPGGTADIPVLAKIPLRNLTPLLLRIASQDSVLARVEGSYRIFGIFAINKATEFYVKPSELIARQVERYVQQQGFRIQSLKPDFGNPGDEMEIDVQVSARNIYPFALGVHEIAADVYSLPGQKRMFQCSSQDTVDLEPGEAQDLTLRFTVRPTEAMAGLGTLTRIALKGNQPVKVVGTLQVSAFGATFTLPVNQEVTVSSDDLGLPGLLDIFKHN